MIAGLPTSHRPNAPLHELRRSLAAVNAEYRSYEPFLLEELEMGLTPRLRKTPYVPPLTVVPDIGGETTPCHECGADMPASKAGRKRKHCSGRCRQRAYDRRQREAVAA